MPHNIKLVIAYDGTHYKGWQKTREGSNIEETLQKVLEKVLNHSIVLQAASRTDAGVHAAGQVVNFFTDKMSLDVGKLGVALNSLLPSDIAVLETSIEMASFHPTLDVKEKEYHYRVAFGTFQMPQNRLYQWHYSHYLNTEMMKLAAAELIGTHDFVGLCNGKKKDHYKNTIRSINSIEIQEEQEKELRFIVKGRNFLYRMVRNIVGTLVYIGCNKLSVDCAQKIIYNKDRTQAGISAPAHGLTLHQITY